MEEVTTPLQETRAPKWRRFAIYFFAAVGLLLSVLMGAAMLIKKEPPVVSFDANEIIEGVMARNYGKYSEAERGWLYVDEATKLTYLVTVVQQKTVNGKDGEELYFVTSGHTINTELDNDDSFYGVFEVQRSNGRLWEFSDPRRPSGTIPVTPENVLFEALSADVWGWVVKISDVESSDGSDLNASTNVVLAPYDGGIAVLGEFYAAFAIVGQGNCEDTERAYASWREAQQQQKSAPAEGESSAMSKEEQVDDNFAPPRCTQLQWSYRTDPVADASFTPLYVTRKAGLRNGEKVEAKTWKVMFDPKSFTYLLPKELKDVSM